MSSAVLDRGRRAARVMIVDNDSESLAFRTQLFGHYGCLVISATSQRDAKRELEASPVPDLILTDLHMPEDEAAGAPGGPSDTSRDVSGLELRDLVRRRFPTVPIGCYSAYYTDETMPEEEWSKFDISFKRGMLTPTQLDEEIQRAVGLANGQMMRRQAEYDDLLAEERSRHVVAIGSAEVVRRLSLEHDAATLVEGRLREAGYELRLVAPQGPLGSAEPLIVWVCPAAEGVEVEAYGFGEVYAFGEGEGEAMARLFELMSVYRERFLREATNSRLLGFLERVLASSVA